MRSKEPRYIDFVPCYMCDDKPVLCDRCAANQSKIDELKTALRVQRRRNKVLRAAIKDNG